jgi:hypothetical protein
MAARQGGSERRAAHEEGVARQPASASGACAAPQRPHRAPGPTARPTPRAAPYPAPVSTPCRPGSALKRVAAAAPPRSCRRPVLAVRPDRARPPADPRRASSSSTVTRFPPYRSSSRIAESRIESGGKVSPSGATGTAQISRKIRSSAASDSSRTPAGRHRESAPSVARVMPRETRGRVASPVPPGTPERNGRSRPW